MGLSLSELIRRVGDEEVRFQNLFESITNIAVRKRGGSQVSFMTTEIGPHDLLENEPRYVALVVYLPYAKAMAVRAEWIKEQE